MSDVNTIGGFDYVTETFDKRGRTRYYQRNPNNFFDTQNAAQGKTKQPNFDFLNLSPEQIGETIAKRRKEKEEYKEKYLIDLSESEHDALNILLQNTDKPEEKVYEFATAIKYSKEFNLPLDFALQNLEAINRNWIGTGTAPTKSNFKAVVDSFIIGANVLKMGNLGNALMKAEKSGNKREIEYALKDLQRLEDENLSLYDRMPRSWLVNLFKDGAQALPFQGATFIPSVIASAAGGPLLGNIVTFGISTTITAGNEYWELRKAGVKKELAENIAVTSGAIQGLIETSLGNIAGFTGKGLGADKIASKVLTQLSAKGVFGGLAKGFTFYGVDLLGQGAEEGLQELVSAGAKATAAALQGEGVETDDALTIARNVWESFKGGIVASVILGIPGAIKFTKADIQSSNNLRKAALTTPSEKAFINENKDSPALEGLTEEDKKNELHNIYEAKKQEREAFQKLQDKKEYLSDTARIEGEAMRDDKGNIVYERDENGNLIKERDEDGNLKPIPKAYGAPEEVVRLSNGGLYIQEGKTRVRKGGIIEGEYIAGNPTQETEYNDYAHIHYTYNENKNTVRIDEVAVENPKYLDIVKEFIRDFGEKFKGAKIEWQTKEEALTKIKNELIAENPNGKENGVQYFVEDMDRATVNQRIKFDEQLKKAKPNMSAEQRQMGYELVKSFAETNFRESADEYISRTFADTIFTDEKFANMDKAAAQQGVNPSDVKGATTWKNIDGYARAVIYLSKKSDFSTLAHELGHVFLETLPAELKAKAEAAFDVRNGQWTAKDKDNFCYSLERYYAEGKAPTPELQTLFEKAADFILRVYKAIENMFVTEISPEIKAVFDEMLGKKDSGIYQAETRFNETERIKQSKKNTTGKYAAAETYENNKITETAEDKKLDDKALKEKYMSYAKENFQGNSYHNADTDTDIRISRDILDEWQSKTKSREQILSIQALDKLIETAVETNTVSDKKDRRNIESIKYFETGLNVNDKTYKAHLTVRAMQKEGNKAYHYYLQDVSLEDILIDRIKKEAALRIDASSKEVNVPLLHGSNTNISENAETVNSKKQQKSKIDEAYDKATEAARLANEESIKQAEADKKDSSDMLFQTEAAKEELNEIEDVRKKYEGTEQWLKAPNGSDSNLNETQWLQVRTDSFKKWFGDWENDSENASKVVDENGEPLVVYHGTAYTFDTFSTPLNMERIFLTKNKTFAHKYGTIALPLFVNARTLLQVDYKGSNAFEEIDIQGNSLESIEDVAEYARDKGYNGVYANNVTDAGTFSSRIEINDEVIVFKPNQIKSATDNTGSFDPDNYSILFQTAPLTEEEKAFKETAEQYRKDINRYFAGEIKSNETVTVCKTTPTILRAVGFEDKPITVSGATLKHITDKHKDITQDILSSLPEQLLDPIAVFKSQNKEQPNSRLIFTEHFVNGKPVLAALEMNYTTDHTVVNSIRSVYEKDSIQTIQNWINDGNLLYVDDKRVDEWSATTGLQLPLRAFSKLNPSSSIIGENAGNVNRVLTKTDIIGDNADALYLKVEKEFYDEVTAAETKQEVKENLEKIIVGKDVTEAENLFYSEEEQKEFDLAYNAKEELIKMTGEKLADIKAKDETFIKMLSSDREAMRSFMKQIIKAADTDAYLRGEINRSGTKFLSEAVLITQNKHPLTDKQFQLSLDFIKENTEFYRNIFAEINGYEALRSVTKKEAAFINAFADSAFEGKEAKTKSRSEIQDEMFLNEMEDDTKFNEFLHEAARIYFFDFENFKALDEEDAAYRDEMKRKQDRIYHELRNFSWKGTLAKIKAGEAPSAKSLNNIHAQIKNAVRSYRDFYSDIMDRPDMKVRDAETTDAIIKTKLKSRPRKTTELNDYKLENMSNAEKAKLLKALNNEELEEKARLGVLTGEDIEKINGIIKEKNENIRALEKEIKELKKDGADNTQKIFKLEKQIKDERINRKVLADTVKARDVALKAVMKRISLKSCAAQEAEVLTAVQWFLKPQVQKALNATIDKTESRFREAYTLWKTSEEYRKTLARMSGGKKGWESLRHILNNKEFDKWTDEDKKLAQRLIPARNKFFSLGLYARTEKNFSDMHTADLSEAQIEEAAKSVLPSETIAKLKHQPLSQWTVDELIDLAKIITEKHSEGKKKYLSWKATQREEAAIIRNAGIKSFKSVKDFEEKAAAWSSDEKDKKGGFAALRRKLKYAAMRPYAFIEMLDGGKRGTLYALLEYEQRECNSVYKNGVDKRLDAFHSFMKANNIDIASLDEKHVFENFYIGKDKKDLTLTTQEVLGAYMASLDEKSRAALQYGNFAEQDERDRAKSSNTYEQLDDITEARLSKVLEFAETLINENESIKKLVEFLQAEYKAEGVKLYEHNKAVNNTITEIRDNYFPMLRLDISGEEDVRTTEEKIKGEYATGSRNSISNGQSKARIFIGKANQTAIQLGAVSTYLQSVEANERLYAYDAYAQKLNRIFKGYDSKQFRNTLETAYGNEAVKYLDKQISTIIDPNAGRVFSSTDKLLRVLRGNTAAAYLGWKLSGIIKQGLTSPAPFLQYVNPVSYAKAATDLAIHNKEMTEFIYSRSSLMKHRSFDMMQNITEELAKNAKTKGEKVLTSIQQKGMAGLEWIDRACVAPGWLAAFREEEARLRNANKTIEKPLTDLEIDLKAGKWADDVLVRTQPSGRAEELAPLFREGGEALRLLLQFQSSLNVIYNNIRHDLPNAIKNKQYGRAAGIITGYALAGIAVGAVTEGFGDDDDETSDKIRKGVYYAFTQYTDSVPVINGIVNGLAEKVITGKTSYKGSSSLYPAFEKAAQGVGALSDGDFKRAAGKYAEAAALSLGLPTSGTKEAFYAAEQLYNGEFPSALFGRRKRR